MKLALCNEVIRDLSFETQCAFAAEVGYDGIELAPFTLAEEPHLLPAAERRRLRGTAERAGVPIASLHWLLVTPRGLSITAADAAVRARTIDVLERLVGLAADLGAAVLVHGSPAQRRLEPGDEAQGRKRAIDCLAQVAAAAEAAGVVHCLEPLAPAETIFVNTLAEAAAIVEAIGSPALRTMIDCSAAAQAEAEPIPALLARWLPTGRIAHVQVNDANRRGPGEGEMRFAPILAALREQGYAGWVAVEPFVYKPDGPAVAARAAGYLRGLLEALA